MGNRAASRAPSLAGAWRAALLNSLPPDGGWRVSVGNEHLDFKIESTYSGQNGCWGNGAVCAAEYLKERKAAIHGFATHKATSLQLSQQPHSVEKAHNNAAQWERYLTRCHVYHWEQARPWCST